MDLARQQGVQANVALIEARDKQEHDQMLRLNAATTAAPVANNDVPRIWSPPQNEPLQAPAGSQALSERHGSTDSRQNEPQIPSSSEPYAPQSWAPRARRRGDVS